MFGSAKVQYNDEEIDLESSWKRLHIVDAVKSYRCRFYNVNSDEEAIRLAKEHDIEITENMKYGHILNEFLNRKLKKHLFNQRLFMVTY